MNERYGGICECGDHAWARLTLALVALVSPEDSDLISRQKWVAARNRQHGIAYVARRRQGRNVYLHRLIAEADKGKVVDHLSGNALDNRRSNLRVCDHWQNSGNARCHRTKRSSSYKGVRRSGRRRWQVSCAGKHIGVFDTPSEAAAAYDKAAVARFGEYARTNASMGLV